MRPLSAIKPTLRFLFMMFTSVPRHIHGHLFTLAPMLQTLYAPSDALFILRIIGVALKKWDKHLGYFRVDPLPWATHCGLLNYGAYSVRASRSSLVIVLPRILIC